MTEEEEVVNFVLRQENGYYTGKLVDSKPEGFGVSSVP